MEFLPVSGEAAIPIKKKILSKLLEKQNRPPVMIFVNQKVDTEILEKYIRELGYSVTALHGGKNQDRREAALENLRSGRVDIMVATNVAARGIDIDSVKHVINFDAPRTLVDYVHRIGRTGRAGKSGMATTLLTPDDEPLFADLRKYLADNDQVVPSQLALPKNVI